MPSSVTPTTLLLRQIEKFQELLPAVRDGGSTAIHDARVATRRMRELVPLVVGGLMPSDTERLDRTLRKATRRLGRARDMEVMLETLADLEPAAPTAAGEIGRLRLEWHEKRDRLVRRAIKSLERMDIETTLHELPWMLAPNKPALFGLRRHASAAPRWEATLVAQLRERAGDAAEAIGRAGGVAFANRLHRARVSLKKLRYSMEIATATGQGNFEQELRLLGKAQDLLGRLHDHDALADALRNARLGAQRLLPLIELQRRRLHSRCTCVGVPHCSKPAGGPQSRRAAPTALSPFAMDSSWRRFRSQCWRYRWLNARDPLSPFRDPFAVVAIPHEATPAECGIRSTGLPAIPARR